LNLNPISINSVTKRYGNLTAVEDVSLNVSKGEIYALLGANGAGKSTLMRMLVGLSDPDEGKIMVCGEEMARHTLATKRHIGYLPEELILYDHLTGKEYLQLVAGLKNVELSKALEELEFFGLTQAQNRWIGGYSLGMRKKLGLAAAMVGAPDVLVLDEPLNGLDVEMIRKFRLRIEQEREKGRTILVSSHIMSFVEQACDRVGIMRAGKLVIEGTPKELRAESGLTSAIFEDVFFFFATR
jgi:ABC-type multidrug transport system ATPase subunit